MEKKKTILIGICLCICLCLFYIKNQEKNLSDAIKFKNEYESLNGQIRESTNTKYVEVKISKDNPIKYSTYEDIKQIITSGTGVIYFGFPECPWCRNALPVLLDAAKENALDTIYYFNALSIRDKKHLDESGKIVIDNAGTKEYAELVELLKEYLDVYEGLNDDTIKRLYFPTVFFIKNGQVVGVHSGTVTTQENPNVELSDSEKAELKDIYTNYMLKVQGSMCTDGSESKC